MSSFSFRSSGVARHKLCFSPRGSKLDPLLSNLWISSWSLRTLSRIRRPEKNISHFHFLINLSHRGYFNYVKYRCWEVLETYLKIFHIVIQLFANHLRCLVPSALGLHKITPIFLTFVSLLSKHAVIIYRPKQRTIVDTSPPLRCRTWRYREWHVQWLISIFAWKIPRICSLPLPLFLVCKDSKLTNCHF